MINQNSKIYIAGHRGMVGSAIWRTLLAKGYKNIIGTTSKDLDLKNQQAVNDFIAKEKPEVIIDAAARVGGILANSNYPYQFLMENMQIQNNLIDAALQAGIEKFIFLGSSCIYPKLAPQPLKEEYLLTGPLEPTNELFAKYFTEALAKEVSDFYIETKSKKARINMAILQKQTDSVRGELNGAITGVAVANDNTFGLNPALNVRRTPSARRQVDVQANTAILTELVKQSELAKVTLRTETPLIQIIDQPILPLKKERFGKAKGIVLGGFLAGFLVMVGLIGRRILKEIS